MNEQQPSPAFISALTTEHYVLQSAISANTSEVGTRASLYLFSLSSSLVALGFASRSPELFGPFVAIVLPALFILGLFTAVRLVDSNLEALLYHDGIARIRRYYRTLGPEAAEHFSAESGRWPENPSSPSLRLGPFVGLITTTASMVAFLNSILAGVGVAMLAGGLLRETRSPRGPPGRHILTINMKALSSRVPPLAERSWTSPPPTSSRARSTCSSSRR